MSQEFKNDIVDIIVELLRDNLGDAFFKEFYNGDPELIGLSSMPCVTVKLENTDKIGRASCRERV